MQRLIAKITPLMRSTIRIYVYFIMCCDYCDCGNSIYLSIYLSCVVSVRFCAPEFKRCRATCALCCVAYVEFGEQFVVFPSQLFRFLHCRTHFHQIRLHLLDAYPYPLMTLQSIDRSINQSINQSK